MYHDLVSSAFCREDVKITWRFYLKEKYINDTAWRKEIANQGLMSSRTGFSIDL